MTPLPADLEAHLKAMPYWLPELEIHRPWVEMLLLDVWNAATGRAAKKCDQYAAEAPNISEHYAATECAAAIRGGGQG
jgi:hypothetical protein